MKKSATMQLIFLFLAVSCIVAAKPVWAPSAIENSWVTKTPLPQTAGGLRAAVVNGKIYAIGGVVNYEYDPAADNWTAKKPMPTARTYFGIAVYQNKIYTIGGSLEWNPSSGSIPSDANEVYDPLTDSWETMEPMPTNRSGLNANVVNGKIYLIGGRTVGPQYLTVALNEVYDPATNSWTTKKPIPIAVVSCASAVIDNKIFVIGGHAEFHDPLNIDTNQIYDPETDTWSLGASLPTVVLDAAAGATTGVKAPKRIYVIGGTLDGSIEGTNVTQAYDPENDTWTFAASMPTARAWLAVAVADDMLYAIGGSPEALMIPFLTTNEQYTPIGYETSPEQQIEPFPTPLIVASVVTVAAISIGLLVYFKKCKR
jgi:N-acetylneuraminic acid mutarotase